jgi:hypothetical protein
MLTSLSYLLTCFHLRLRHVRKRTFYPLDLRVTSSMGILNPGISARILHIDGSRADCDVSEVGELFLDHDDGVFGERRSDEGDAG